MAQEYSPPIRQYSPPATNEEPRTMTAEESRHELQQAITGSNQILTSASTVFAMFPDTVIIDRAKVTLIKRQFFRTAEVMSMRIEDVLNATCTVGPFFGTLSITSRVLNDDQTSTIGMFWRSDAKRLKRVLQGYAIALERKIDCSSLETSELSRMLERLGADNHPNA